MDVLTFVCLTSSFLLVAYFHREEKKKGKAGVLYIGGVFDVFWTLVESIPTGSQVANWLDRRFKKHEVGLKEQVENKHLQKHPHKHSHKHLHEQSTKGQVQSTKGQVQSANFATTGVTNSGPEAQKKSQKSKSSKRRSKDSSQKHKHEHKHEHKKSGISSSQKNKSKSSKRKASVKLPTEKSQPVEQ